MSHSTKPNPTTDHAHRRPVIQHGNETSVNTAEPRRDPTQILDTDNGESSYGRRAGPGAGGPPLADAGSSSVPDGMV